MKNFIEVTEKENKKIFLNINYIIQISTLDDDEIANCTITLNSNASSVEVLESYEEIKQRIETI